VGTPTLSAAMLGPKPATPVPVASPLPLLKFISPPTDAEAYLDDDTDDVESWYRTVDNILSVASPPGLAMLQVAAELHLLIEEESAVFSEAEQHQVWQRTMLE
jgi:hypothetical protein